MRLIDADALASALNNGRLEEQTGRAVPFNAGVAFALTMVEYAPTIEPKRGEWIDAVPVVRCKDCKRRRNAKKNGRVYWDGYEYYCEIAHYGVTDDGFCFYGERKDDE